MKIITAVIIAITSLAFTSCEDAEDVKYRNQYQGVYTIYIEGVSEVTEVDVFELKKDGEAQWYWVFENFTGEGASIENKSGSWSATKNSITVELMDNSEMVIIPFVLKDGVFTEVNDPKRTLHLVKDEQYFAR